jgi:signal transduction histidine kinase
VTWSQLPDSFLELLGTLPGSPELRYVRALAERERLADSIRDTVVNRLYGVGLTLHVLLQHELTPAADERIWSAINELDESIVAVRDAIFPR